MEHREQGIFGSVMTLAVPPPYSPAISMEEKKSAEDDVVLSSKEIELKEKEKENSENAKQHALHHQHKHHHQQQQQQQQQQQHPQNSKNSVKIFGEHSKKQKAQRVRITGIAFFLFCLGLGLIAAYIVIMTGIPHSQENILSFVPGETRLMQYNGIMYQSVGLVSPDNSSLGVFSGNSLPSVILNNRSLLVPYETTFFAHATSESGYDYFEYHMNLGSRLSLRYSFLTESDGFFYVVAGSENFKKWKRNANNNMFQEEITDQATHAYAYNATSSETIFLIWNVDTSDDSAEIRVLCELSFQMTPLDLSQQKLVGSAGDYTSRFSMTSSRKQNYLVVQAPSYCSTSVSDLDCSFFLKEVLTERYSFTVPLLYIFFPLVLCIVTMLLVAVGVLLEKMAHGSSDKQEH